VISISLSDRNFTADDPERIHELPAIVEEHLPPSERQLIENRSTDFSQEITGILAMTGEGLFETVPPEVLPLGLCVKQYVRRLTSGLHERFFVHLGLSGLCCSFLLLCDHEDPDRKFEFNFCFICGNALRQIVENRIQTL
jgi:hypothetical protein